MKLNKVRLGIYLEGGKKSYRFNLIKKVYWKYVAKIYCPKNSIVIWSNKACFDQVVDN